MLFVRHAVDSDDLVRIRNEARKLGVETVQSDMPHGSHCVLLDEITDDPSQSILRPLAEKLLAIGCFTEDLAKYVLDLVKKQKPRDPAGVTKELFVLAMSEPGSARMSSKLSAMLEELPLCIGLSGSSGRGGD